LNKETNISPDNFQIKYNAYENLCSFYNRSVLKKAGVEHSYRMNDYDESSFISIYNRIFSDNKTISAEDLFDKGISEYKEKRSPNKRVSG
ncbi:MAG: hypothetical protein U9N53_08490, partial [Bacteroidota bacterium]|nr:hypothetical protein [Bacteroidota bacterium]